MAKTVDQDVLEVLSALHVDVHSVKIATQLDRKMYLRVNEVLSAIGGVWNRKAGAHVFDGDPQEGLDSVITTGEVVRAKDLGFFATPADLAKELVSYAEVEAGMNVLEPSAGEGAIVAALLAAGACVEAIELDAGRAKKLLQTHARIDNRLNVVTADFMLSTADGQQRIVMNPPFCKVNGFDHLDHVQHAFKQLSPGGVLVSVLPVSVEFRQDRRYMMFREWLAIHSGDIQPLPDGSFKESGTNVRTVVLKMRAT